MLIIPAVFTFIIFRRPSQSELSRFYNYSEDVPCQILTMTFILATNHKLSESKHLVRYHYHGLNGVLSSPRALSRSKVRVLLWMCSALLLTLDAFLSFIGPTERLIS